MVSLSSNCSCTELCCYLIETHESRRLHGAFYSIWLVYLVQFELQLTINVENAALDHTLDGCSELPRAIYNYNLNLLIFVHDLRFTTSSTITSHGSPFSSYRREAWVRIDLWKRSVDLDLRFFSTLYTFHFSWRLNFTWNILFFIILNNYRIN